MLCTLLGPEGSGSGFLGFGFFGGCLALGVPFLGVFGVVGWFFENCIVDVSIFILWCVVLFGKFLWHTVDALVPEADEGRWSLRYALGSWQPSVDLGISEWGNLARGESGYLRLNV